jgi:type I restriction enzyme S subunit
MSSSVVPSGWHITTLEACVDILDSQRVPVNNIERQTRIQSKSPDQLYPYFGATGEVGKIDNYLFDEELVALGEDGVPFLDPRKPKAYKLSGKTWVNNHAHVLRAAGGATTNQFLLHYLNQFDYQGYVNGGTRLKLTQANMRRMPFPIPPLAEQKVIADKLDTLLTQVENTKARLECIPQILKRFRQSVLDAAVSGRLTEEWRERNPRVKSPLLSEIKEYWTTTYRAAGKKPPKPYLVGDVESTMAPNSWLETRVGQVFDVFVGSTPSRSRPDYWNGEIPWVSSSEVAFCRIKSTKEKITESGLASASTTAHPIGTVMLAMIGQGKTRGQVAILDIPACHNQNTAALRVPEGFVEPHYLYYYLAQRYEKTRQIGGGNNQKALNKRFVQSMDFALPPLEEQTKIVRRVDQLFAHADTIEQQVNNALARVNNITQSILAKAFRGELTEQWRKDNPELINGENSAEALLERIKAERDVLSKKTGSKISGSKKKTDRHMKTTTREELIGYIESIPAPQFSFNEIVNAFEGDYEKLKECFFALLSDNQPVIEQRFDSNAGKVVFIKVEK